ncbi:MAG: hypothetical protein ACI843_002857 [Psychrobacter glaciei]|jgi:hypothetical protein
MKNHVSVLSGEVQLRALLPCLQRARKQAAIPSRP